MMSQYRPEFVIIFIFFHICLIGPTLGQTEVASPFVLFGPHGYRTFEHSRCQNVPTVDVDLGKISGTWYLVKYVNSHDGKPTGGHTPYLCPEVMHLDDKNMVFFLCIDYTIWPGWNHRGVYVLSRTKEQKEKVRRQLSNEAR